MTQATDSATRRVRHRRRFNYVMAWGVFALTAVNGQVSFPPTIRDLPRPAVVAIG